jgi:hypothetical protein
MKALSIAVPAGIGDALWPLTKIPSLLKVENADGAHIVLCGGLPRRSKEFVEAFDFVASAEYSDYECIYRPCYWTESGAYNWAHSQPGWHGWDWMLCANKHLEEGGRLEHWMPHLETDFEIGKRFRFTEQQTEFASRFLDKHGPYAVLYFGPEPGNTAFGHNRGGLWSVRDWQNLARYLRGLGLKTVAVGASYDRSYADHVLDGDRWEWIDAIGQWPIGVTFAVIRKSMFVIGYQSGLVIFPPFLGVRTMGFWRPYGSSISPDVFVSFREEMATAWVPPEVLSRGDYIPLIYTKCSPEAIIGQIVERSWHKPRTEESKP